MWLLGSFAVLSLLYRAEVSADPALLELAGPDGTRTLRLTQGELATMVGGARQSVNQVLKSLKARGYVRVAGRGVELLEREELHRLAGG